MSGGRRGVGRGSHQAARLVRRAAPGAPPPAKPELTVPEGRDTQAAIDQAAADLIAALDGTRELRLDCRRLRAGRATPERVVADAMRRHAEIGAAIARLRASTDGPHPR